MNVKNLVLATLLVSSNLTILSSCDKTEKTPQKEIGLQLYSIREDIKDDLNSSLDSVANVGYALVEAANYNDGKFYNLTPQEFNKLLKDKGLIFISSHIGRDVPNEDNYDETMAWWDQAIAAHKEAGVPYIVQPWMGQVGYGSLEIGRAHV